MPDDFPLVVTRPWGLVMSHHRLGAIAARQASCFSTAQADRCGFDDGRRRRMVRDGFWERLGYGVYAISGSVDSPERRLWAAWLAVGPAAAFSFEAGLWQWDMSPGKRFPGPQLLVPASSSVRRRGIETHRTSDFADLRTPLRRGLPTVTPMRALVDAATSLPIGEVEEAYDRGVGRKLISPLTVLGELDRWGRHGQYRLDFYWAEARLAVEVHGWDFHSSPKAVARDFRRRNRICLDDVLVLDYTYSQIVYEPQEVLKELNARLRPTLFDGDGRAGIVV